VHTAMIEDWELGVLYRREVERLGDEQAAVANVRKKFFDEICGPSKDTRFFHGDRVSLQHVGGDRCILASQGIPTFSDLNRK